MISRSNYEIVFVDYYDGKLDKIQKEELFSFLSKNPDLQEEFNLYSEIQTIPDVKISFAGKEKLKKNTITIYNYKTWLVGYIENDLLSEQKKEVDYFLSKNPSLKTELEILKLSRLTPDKRIIYNKKNALKKSAKVIYFTPALKRTLSVAAVLIFLTITYFIIQQINSAKSIVADQKNSNEQLPDKNNIQNRKNKSIIDNKNSSLTYTDNKNKIIEVKAKPIFVSRNNIKTNPIIIKKQQNILTADTILTPQFELKNSLADNSKVDPLKTGDPVNGITNNSEAKLAQLKNTLLNNSDIFNSLDLDELGILSKEKSNPKTLTELASGEIKKLSKSKDFSLDKQKDPLGKSTTYALEIGKRFSISHTTDQ